MSPAVHKTLAQTVLFFSLLFSCELLVAVEPPSPEEVINKASVGRIEFIKMTSELQGLAPQITSKEILYSYIELIPELSDIATKLDFESLGASPVEVLANSLTRNALKWVRVSTDSKEFLRLFFKLAESQTKYLVASQQAEYLKRAESKEELLAWSAGVAFSLSTILELKSEPFVVTEFEQLQVETVQRILLLSSMFSQEEIARVFHEVNGKMALGELLNVIHQKVANANEINTWIQLFSWVSILSQQVAAFGESLSVNLRLLPAQIFIDILGRVLIHGDVLPQEMLSKIYPVFLPTQWLQLGHLLVNIFGEREIPANQVRFVGEILKEVRVRVRDLGDNSATRELLLLASRVVVNAMVLQTDAEGVFEIETSQGKGSMIISSMGNGRLIISVTLRLSDASPYAADYSFYHVDYDSAEELFKAQHFAQGSPIYPHHTFKTWDLAFSFQKLEEGLKIQGKLNNNHRLIEFHGNQTVRFSAFQTLNAQVARAVTGVYRGTLVGRPIELSLTELDMKTLIGELQWGYVSQPFNYGFVNKGSGKFILSTGEMPSFKWAQLKGQFFNDGKTIRGFYIVSGDTDVKEVVLNLISSELN